MTEFIVKYWLEVVFAGVISLLAFGFRILCREYKALKTGLTAILRDRIVTAYYHYEERGSITLHGLENVNRMFKEYENLGGNGSVRKLVEDMNKLEVVDS